MAEADVVKIATDDINYALSLTGRGLWLEGAPMLAVDAATGRAVVGGHRIDPEILWAEDSPVAADRFPDACDAVDQALSLLTAAGVEARGWVDRMTRVISIVAPQPNGLTSSRSTATRPGNLLVTAPLDPLALAEALVHEASHQYFALCGRLGGFVHEARRHELFYSAINDLQRPIGRLALALHAIANMMILYDDILESGAHGELAHARLSGLDFTARSLADTVHDHRDAFLPHVLGFIGVIVETVHDIGRKHRLSSFAQSRARPQARKLDPQHHADEQRERAV